MPIQRPLLAAFALMLSLPGTGTAGPGLEWRAYPAGSIVNLDQPVATHAGWQWSLLAGYDFARRGDAGRHQDEFGGGPGVGVAARYPGRAATWFWGGRLELFQLYIDWRDPGGRTGNSEVTVLQPSLQLGYRIPAVTAVDLSIAAHVGVEVNLETRGEPVGEGAIGLLGLRLGLR